MTTESDPLAGFRTELRRCRELLDLTHAEAGRRAGITGARWSAIERGYEIKNQTEIPANPRRSTLMKMARAVGWAPAEALRLAGYRPLAERERERSDQRDDLWAQLQESWPGLTPTQQTLIVALVTSMRHPQIPLQVSIREVTSGAGEIPTPTPEDEQRP